MNFPGMIRCTVYFLFMVLVAACNFKPEELIIGTWKNQTGDEVFVFDKGGEVRNIRAGIERTGTFTVVDQERLRMELHDALGDTERVDVRIAFTNHEMTMMDERGLSWSYRKLE